MKFTTPLRVSLIASVCLISAHRLPAPISEIETPTPTLTPPKEARRTQKTENKSSAKPITQRPLSKSTPQTTKPSNRSRFAGTWTGTVSVPGWGNLQGIWVINAAENSVTENFPAVHGPKPCAATVNGATISWVCRGGIFNAFWSVTTLTLTGDGQTALMTIKDSSGGAGSPSEVKRTD